MPSHISRLVVEDLGKHNFNVFINKRVYPKLNYHETKRLINKWLDEYKERQIP